MKKASVLLVLFLFVIPLAAAREGSMKLLAVREANNEGSVADLFLEVKSGTGRVFIETVPLTKFDTQISTRFAKDIACDYLDRDCSRYDFFYAINADAPIIGGPSAGAAISVLTAAVLEDVEIDEDVSITGTINSGGVIGPVGGLKAKIEAASEANINTVLIPKGERFLKEINLTLDLTDYAKKYNVAVVEAGDLTDALYYFTGRRFKEDTKDFEVNKEYENTMRFLAKDLCNRTEKLKKEFAGFEERGLAEDFTAKKENADNLSTKGEEAYEKEAYYSAASFCFGANLKYREILLRLNRYDDFVLIEKEISDIDSAVDGVPINTISDLQTYIIVKERIKDASNYLESAKESYGEGEDYEVDLAYAVERIYSAKSWSVFFDIKGREFDFERKSLMQSCMNKLSEAEERYNYAKLYFPNTLEGSKKELEDAYEDFKNDDYELCLFKASKVKAESDVVLSVVGVAENQIETVLENKLKIVRNVMAEQQEKGMFPILGYSYYEYANQLKEDNKISALLYTEYALELSNLDIYFNHKKKFVAIGDTDGERLMLFLGGIVIGVMAVFLIKRKKKQK
ncbi:hypothetical protein GF361_00855 [Candidatus Woesearchaeota archaeon]|nr:hypothetical protein [Candidatus Woesearchaeota archaeon]